MSDRRCACGCGALLPAGMRPQARYLDGAHRAAASAARKGRPHQNPPATAPKPHKKRTKRVTRDTVTVVMTPDAARLAASLLRATGAPQATIASDAIRAGLKRRGDRIERATDGMARG